MSTTLLSSVSDQVQKFWAPMFKDLLLEDNYLAKLVNKDYQGVISGASGGDTVYVSGLNRPTAQRKTVGAGDDSFSSSAMSTTRVAIQANQRITASFDISDLVDLQSQLGAQESQIRARLLEACNISLNEYLYSLVAPSTSAPDHTITSVTDFNATQIAAVRKLASAAKWPRDGRWYLLLDPQYFNDFLGATTMVSGDYTGGDQPTVDGVVGSKRFGFNVLEDNSSALTGLGTTGQDCALAFHPDFMYMVMQKEPQFKLSDLHPMGIHGYKLSVDLLVGATAGIEGSVKCVTVINS